jgi:hypothetical protein
MKHYGRGAKNTRPRCKLILLRKEERKRQTGFASLK